ncbi:MAG: hypothetical protein Q4F29_01655 [Lachnospiraceae bacterium]|nr:hypothetical protein [Lachnospiraceae bacterium]
MEEEPRYYKALYFDLNVKRLQMNFSAKNPNEAYRKIQRYLLKQNFSHIQYSGYHSRYKTTDLEIFNLIWLMNQKFPWMSQCLNHFEVTNIGKNYDLMWLLDAMNSNVDNDRMQAKIESDSLWLAAGCLRFGVCLKKNALLSFYSIKKNHVLIGNPKIL